MKAGSKLYAFNDQELLTVLLGLRALGTDEAKDIAMYLTYMQFAQAEQEALAQVAVGRELDKKQA